MKKITKKTRDSKIIYEQIKSSTIDKIEPDNVNRHVEKETPKTRDANTYIAQEMKNPK
ncbi:hypothetical protein BB558_001431 [Smittium angustum]|uniref:Uncharacterized protein n=1 Tax=Smittium angustum TaxID=133377 RepID=A0A2U1JBE7_SMIAN|nr:hypothetical protein BB558_001431 [Smittium angustum]